MAPACSNCGSSDFVWANELKTGMTGSSLSLRARGEVPLGTRICRSCGHADLFLRDLTILHQPHLWRPGEFVPISPKPKAEPAPHHHTPAPAPPPPQPPAAPAPPPPAPERAAPPPTEPTQVTAVAPPLPAAPAPAPVPTPPASGPSAASTVVAPSPAPTVVSSPRPEMPPPAEIAPGTPLEEPGTSKPKPARRRGGRAKPPSEGNSP